MMRNSSSVSIVTLLIVAALALLALILIRMAWLKAIRSVLNSSQPVALPTSATPIPNFSIPTAPAPVSVGKEAIVNNLGITVIRVINPADNYIGKAALPSVRQEGKQYLVVDIKVRCASKTKCRLTEFDFGVQTKSGHDYPAELSIDYSDDLDGVFEGGDIEPGNSLSGSLIFIIQKGESGLTLIYPRMYGLGSEAKFMLTK
jgi:hypothetical protein